MKRPTTRIGLRIIPAAMLLAGCTGGVVSGGGGGDPGPNLNINGAHIMPIHHPGDGDSVSSAVSSSPHLVYNGGPVLSSVNIQTVFWNSSVSNQSRLNAFYTAVTASAYFDWLSEYNTPSQTIGRGTFGGSVVASGATGNVTDGQIQSQVAALIDAGRVAAPTANSLYMVHFPPGAVISMSDGSRSCSTFCAYHSSFSHNGHNVYYGVLPDVASGGCQNGCGSNSDPFNNQTSVSSHEMIEAVTDADVGQGDVAWYDDNYGEIGDICNARQGSAAGYTVQLEWSNQAGACVDHRGNVTPPPPTNPPPTNPPPTNPPPTNPPPTGGSELVVNGGFEDGAFGGWTLSGVTKERSASSHTGTYCARVGDLNAYNGDSSIAQTIAIPSSGTTTLSFWYMGSTSDTIQYDQQNAQVRDTSGHVLASIFNSCENDTAWKQATLDLTPYRGKSVVLYFQTHDDGYAGDPTYLLIDDVSALNH
ncbi:MAG TPA: carbohydrate binding domain-containing protein [Polyangia bacterium]|nr:carbohydrate binding domain-containing protein [Polyangia bacterium]